MINRIKGMYDILPPDTAVWRRVEDAFLAVSRRYGFAEARTPILERTELFSRSIGETTDIVEKEMYTFADKSERSLTLRPEGTASMVRAYIENNVPASDAAAKWVYIGPMYRYERPQKGRNRQFSQLGAEVFGVDAASQDAELIVMAWRFLESLDLAGHVSLEINSLGDAEERRRYREVLVGYLEGHRAVLCEDCVRRLGANPMRVLDCKMEACSAVAAGAPMLLDHIDGASRTHFDALRRGLEAAGVPYAVNPRIVRGLDYYNRTAFEFKTGELGAQDAIGGGGRYDGLVAELGGPPTPAVGFALGLDRVVLLLGGSAVEAAKLDFYVAPLSEAAQTTAVALSDRLRKDGLIGEVDFSGRRLKHLFARAERRGARTVLILGDDELAKGVVQARDMAAKTQREIRIDDLSRRTLG
ncbi:MAG: histidine--tRNA ligase [Myxococcales bacterium]|nr:MAG: histidine--tRNA ligase [Myxococcales bacterium]